MNGSIIFTSRQPYTDRSLVDHELEVRQMLLEQSREFFFRLLPQNIQAWNPEELWQAEQMCKLVNGLPLAIILATNLIRDGLATFAEILEMLKSRELLSRWSLAGSGIASESPLAILWEANICRLRNDTLMLLRVIAFLDPDGIDETMLTNTKAQQLGDILPSEPPAIILSLRDLSDHSLIRRDTSTLSVHRLTQDATIQLMDVKTRGVAFDIAARLMWMTLPKQENRMLMDSLKRTGHKYLPHIEYLKTRIWEFSLFETYRSIHFAEVAYAGSW